MKDRILKSILKILGVAAAGATVTACYGSPYGHYEVKGKVLDEDSNPIGGILITAEEYVYRKNIDSLLNEGVDLRSYGFWTTVSQVDGFFFMDGPDYFPTGSSGDYDTRLYAIDIDGDENGGKFEKREISFDFIEIEAPDGSFYLGDYTTDEILITMQPEQKSPTL